MIVNNSKFRQSHYSQNFSCIIGPNGSGKSNVIDSMLFVFGYKSAKIRSKKLSVLIHNSEQHPDCTSCTVEVHFQMIRDIVSFSDLSNMEICLRFRQFVNFTT